MVQRQRMEKRQIPCSRSRCADSGEVAAVNAVPCLACKQQGLDETDEYCKECGGEGVLPLP